MARRTKTNLSAKAREQRDHLMVVTNGVVVRAIFLLRERGWDADQIAKELGVMLSAAGTAVIRDAATNAEIDYETGEFTADSLDTAIDATDYAKHLVEAMCKEGGER